jgi:TetR/AcrR family transcriptional regulator, regulator of cefoperazone and chloramphenicol sensitivity
MRTDGTAPRRHPEQGGYARGELTRARIVAAAIRAFGDEGYDQASTRKIAASAGVNPPALQYYFDSKEGLHRACAQHIIDRVLAILAPALDRAAVAVRARTAGPALDALCELLEAMVDCLVAVGSESWSRFIARGKADGAGPAMSMIHDRIGSPLVDAMARLVARVTRRPAAAEVTRIRVCTVLGQVSSLYANRENTLAVIGWSQFDPHGLALIKSVVREHTRAALRADVVGHVGAARARKFTRR